MVYGTSQISAGGFACTPGSGLHVVVAPGSVLATGTIDDTAYGSLPAVSSLTTRQYIMRDAATLAVPGTGATYVVYATGGRVDTAGAALPYYNASNPSQALAGPGNDGLAQPTIRQDLAVVAIGASVPSGGSVALWQVTVPAGATSITAAMIALAPGSAIQPTIPQLNPGRLISRQIVTNSGTYTPSQYANTLRVRMAGAGGGGGGATTNSGNSSSAGVGGAAGAYMEFTVALSAITTPVAVGIGTPGVGSATPTPGGLNGTAGTGTTFGTYANCSGGGGGAGGGATAPGNSSQLGSSAGGAYTSNTVQVIYACDGANGAPSLVVMNGTSLQPLNTPSLGADSKVGTGGANNNAGTGGNASGYGAGGGGAGSVSGTAYAGGSGSSGWMYIEEYT